MSSFNKIFPFHRRLPGDQAPLKKLTRIPLSWRMAHLVLCRKMSRGQVRSYGFEVSHDSKLRYVPILFHFSLIFLLIVIIIIINIYYSLFYLFKPPFEIVLNCPPLLTLVSVFSRFRRNFRWRLEWTSGCFFNVTNLQLTQLMSMICPSNISN